MTKELVKKNSPLLDRLTKEVLEMMPPAEYLNLKMEPQTFHGSKNLFDVSIVLSFCACKVLPMHFSSKPTILESFHNANKLIRDRWESGIQESGISLVLKKDYLALDNEMYMQTRIPLVTRIDEKLVVMYFYYLNTNELQKIKETSARKKDVYENCAGIYLLNADKGVIVYEDGINCEMFEIGRDPKLFETIERKCKMMRDYLLIKKVPKCKCKKQ